MSSPEPTSSTSASAISATTSPLCVLWRRREPVVAPPSSRSASSTPGAAARSAGSSPNARPVTSETTRANPSTQGSIPISFTRGTRVNEIGIDPWVLGFALVVSLVTGLAFGLLPALRAAGAGVEEVLREEGGATTGSRRRHRTQNGLVVAEIALALVLLVGSGLLITTFVRLTSVDPGYDTHDVLAARIRLTPSPRRDCAPEGP